MLQMKQSKIYICLATCAVVWGMLSSCEDKLYNEGNGVTPTLTARYLGVEGDGFTFSAEGGNGLFTVEAMNTPWKLNIADDWLTSELLEGSYEGTGLVGITAVSNPSTYYRVSVMALEADLTDNSYTYSKQLPVIQYGTEPEASVPYNPMTCPATGGTYTIPVTTNSPSFTTSTDQSWIKVSQEGTVVTMTLTDNTTSNTRSGHIYFDIDCQQFANSVTTKRFYMEVLQTPPAITATTERLSFNENAGSAVIAFTSDLPWTAYASHSWIQVDPESGLAGESDVTVSVTANGEAKSRTGYVYLKMATGTVEIPVYQAGLYLDASPGGMTFESGESTQILSVKTNLSFWSVLEHPDWASVTPESGETGVHELKVTVAENNETQMRYGKLVIGNKGLGLSYTVELKQNGKRFGQLDTQLQFENTASSATVDITTDGSWVASTTNDWITLAPMSGKGNGVLTVSVQANQTDNTRQGVVSVAVGGTVQTMNVIQKGRYFTIDRNTTATLPSTGGNIELGVTTNQAWKAGLQNHSSWLSLSATEGAGNAKLTIKVNDNPSLESRSETVVFTPDNKQGVKLIVTQNGRQLAVSTSSVAFFYRGGEATPVTVSTDGTFRAETSTGADWLTLTTSGNLLHLSAKAYDGTGQRTASVYVYLTGLVGDQAEAKMAEIRVTQYTKGSQFIRNEYNDDVRMEVVYKDGTVVVRNDYDEDTDLNDSPDDMMDVDRKDYEDDTSLE